MSAILVLGASYGSLFATKAALAGHHVTLVCRAGTADLINREGTVVRFPVRGEPDLVAVHSGELPGTIDAAVPDDVDPARFDLAVLAMQESQYADPSVQRLMRRIAHERVPCLAIMNMPPPPFLRRIAGVDADGLRTCYATQWCWDAFDPALVTLASPDAQAFRPPQEGNNVLVVGLPTNFKAATFGAPQPTALLEQLAADIDAARLQRGDRQLELPVKLKVHASLFAPLAKWPMLITGNYRCIQREGMVSIHDAVHADLERSRRIYTWVTELCCRLGACEDDLVPFDKYARAALSLQKPSSAARAVSTGASSIERVDRLVHQIAGQLRLPNPDCSAIVALVDARLQANGAASREAVAA
jgi:hypothetical protein